MVTRILKGFPYPKEGMRQIISEFEDAFLNWACHNYTYNNRIDDGIPDTIPDTRWFQMNNVEISLLSRYAEDTPDSSYIIQKRFTHCPVNFWGIFHADEKAQLAAYAAEVGLSFNISSRKDYWQISMSGKLRLCGMNRLVDQMKAKIKNAVPMAQMFYELPLLDEITRKTSAASWRKDINKWWYGTYTMGGTYFTTEYDSDGYSHRPPFEGFSFQEFGYRNLRDEDELIAFALACACKYKLIIPPKDLDLQYLRWYCHVEDGELAELPDYYNPNTSRPKEETPPLKEFF